MQPEKARTSESGLLLQLRNAKTFVVEQNTQSILAAVDSTASSTVSTQPDYYSPVTRTC